MAKKKTRTVQKTRIVNQKRYNSSTGGYEMVSVPETYDVIETYTDYSDDYSSGSSDYGSSYDSGSTGYSE